MNEMVPAKPYDVSQAQKTDDHSRQRRLTPRVDILEQSDELVLYADMPGVTAESVDLQFEKGELVIHGSVAPHEKEGDDESTPHAWLNEYPVADYHRAFAIDESIDSQKITAEMRNGILTVHLPKMDQVKPRKIEVT